MFNTYYRVFAGFRSNGNPDRDGWFDEGEILRYSHKYFTTISNKCVWTFETVYGPPRTANVIEKFVDRLLVKFTVCNYTGMWTQINE